MLLVEILHVTIKNCVQARCSHAACVCDHSKKAQPHSTSSGYTRRRRRRGSLRRDSTPRPSRSRSPSLRRGVSTIRFVKPAIIRSAKRRPSSRSMSKRSMSNSSSRYCFLRRCRSASAHACLSSSFGPSSHACRRFRSRSAQAATSASDTDHGSLAVSEALSEAGTR